MGWQNWSGGVRADTAEVVVPTSEAEVVEALVAASREGLTVRPAGAGHSFSPLVATEGVVVDLRHLTGVVGFDSTTGRARVRAGTRLADLGAPLWEAGASLHNQGDVDTQLLGGAVGTGTHGTGPTLRNLSSAVVGARVVLADGSAVECSSDTDAELFEACRVSLGAVGVITELELATVPRYHLHERTWLEPTAECLVQLDSHIAATRHFEFFWLPQQDRCFCKALHPHPGPPDDLPDRRFERVDRAHRVFPSVRQDRFNEMEYAVPADAGPACFAELQEMFLGRHPEVTWPIEYRTLAADDLWISPATGRPTVTLSVHQGAALDHRALFADAEAIFRSHGGRPHWGKLHAADPAELAGHYPHWDRFWSAVNAADPAGRFRSSYLRHLSGR